MTKLILQWQLKVDFTRIVYDTMLHYGIQHCTWILHNQTRNDDHSLFIHYFALKQLYNHLQHTVRTIHCSS